MALSIESRVMKTFLEMYTSQKHIFWIETGVRQIVELHVLYTSLKIILKENGRYTKMRIIVTCRSWQ